MPVLLPEKDFDPWLSGAARLELLRPAPKDLLASHRRGRLSSRMS